MQFARGSLWEQIVRTTELAKSAGALLPIPTEYTFVEDGGIGFFIRILTSLSRKDVAREEQRQQVDTGKNVDPFLPPEPDLTVADVSDTHIAVLNKFNVMEHHLLIITRAFEDQAMLLTLSDFEALWICMAEFNALGFYNGGQEAGASQQHRHLQMVPLPLAPRGPLVPIDPLLINAPHDGLGTIPGFPFLHSFVRLSGATLKQPHEAARETYKFYTAMLAAVNMATPATTGLTRQSRPYCFIVTRTWMLLIPRSREFFYGISLNSLAYAGSLFVRTKEQLERLMAAGPLNALESVSVAKNSR
jgi:sulfate adenylyltransferase (ADP) / ATP adenylyltransferase